jgi:hypothetical protein
MRDNRPHRGIAEASNDAGFGLKLGTEERFERYDPIKIAALAARSFGDAVEHLSRYKQLTCPEEIRVVGRGDERAVQFVWLLAGVRPVCCVARNTSMWLFRRG